MSSELSAPANEYPPTDPSEENSICFFDPDTNTFQTWHADPNTISNSDSPLTFDSYIISVKNEDSEMSDEMDTSHSHESARQILSAHALTARMHAFRAFADDGIADSEEEELEMYLLSEESEEAEDFLINVWPLSRDYRRFRNYDLMRIRLNTNQALGSVSISHRNSADRRRLENIQTLLVCTHQYAAVNHSMTDDENVPTMIFQGLGKLKLPKQSPIFYYIYDQYYESLTQLLRQTRVLFEHRDEIPDAQLFTLMLLATLHAASVTENILCNFEGVARIGKRVITLINRLQALTARYLVLEDVSRSQNSMSDAESDKKLDECISDLELMKTEMSSLVLQAKRAELYMLSKHELLEEGKANVDATSTDLQDLLVQIHNCRDTGLRDLEGIFDAHEDYAKLMSFLTCMKPDEIRDHLVNDFNKIQFDISSLQQLRALLIESTEELKRVQFDEVV